MKDFLPGEGSGHGYRSALIVANPISGRGLGRRAAEELSTGLRQRGIPCEVHLTGGRGDAFEKLRTMEQPADLVVAVGGDGTVREVLDGLVDPSTHVGLLPIGTANVLATELGLPRDVHHALDILIGGRAMEIDVLRVNGTLATFVVGVGIDALTVRELERRRRGPIRKSHYLPAALRALRGYHPPELAVELDGSVVEGTFGFVLVSNTTGYGAVLHLSPDARMDDGELEVYLFPKGTKRELLGAFVRGVVGHLPAGAVRMERARSIRIRSREEVPYQVDGDLGGVTPVEVALAPNRYTVLVPRVESSP